jgi:hypothetical protein
MEDLKGLEPWIMALLHGILHPALTGRKEPTEKSQSGEFEDPQNPEQPNVCPSGIDKMQSVKANPPPVRIPA